MKSQWVVKESTTSPCSTAWLWDSGNLFSILSFSTCFSKKKFYPPSRWMRGWNKIGHVKALLTYKVLRQSYRLSCLLLLLPACWWQWIKLMSQFVDGTYLLRRPWIFFLQLFTYHMISAHFTPKHTFLPKCLHAVPYSQFSYSWILLF
jgi:hypothetical protein